MTLLIAIILIHGFGFGWGWYIVALVLYSIHAMLRMTDFLGRNNSD